MQAAAPCVHSWLYPTSRRLKVSPHPVPGEHRNVRQVAHSVCRIAENARLPRRLCIPHAPRSDVSIGARAVRTTAGSPTASTYGNVGILIGGLCAVTEAACTVCGGETLVIAEEPTGAGVVPGYLGNIGLGIAVVSGVSGVPISAECNAGFLRVVVIFKICAAHGYVVWSGTPACDADAEVSIVVAVAAEGGK